MAKKLTPKQRVLKRYPKAYSWRWDNGLCGIEIDNPANTLGVGSSYKEAWAEAAESIRRIDRKAEG